MRLARSESEPGAVPVPGADGYRYADDHPWGEADQEQLTDTLWQIVRDANGEVPPKYRQSTVPPSPSPVD